MLYRLKFRIYGGTSPGKFAYNLEESSPLYLSETFRPTEGWSSSAYYCLEVADGRSTVKCLRDHVVWNGTKVAAQKLEIHPGHTLAAQGITVEILECPVAGEFALPEERTQFLDIHAARQAQGQSSAPSPQLTPAVSAPAETESPSRKIVTSAGFTPNFEEDDEEDKVPSTREPSPPPFVLPSPHASSASAAPASPQPTSFDPQQRFRRNTFAQAAGLAVGFAFLIFVANRVADRYQFDLFGDQELQIPVVIRKHHRDADVAQPQRPLLDRGPASINETAGTATPTEHLPAVRMTGAKDEPAAQGKLADAQKTRELFQAIENDDLVSVHHLIENENLNPDFTLDELGRPPFLRAAAGGHVGILQYLLLKKVAITAVDYSGNNALMWAAINGHEKTARFLMGLGLDPTAKRDDGKNSFILARENRQIAIIKTLSQFLSRERAERRPASRR